MTTTSDLPGVVTSVSWQLPPGLSYDEWLRYGRRLGKGDNQLLLGDWWLYGIEAYGKKVDARRHGFFEEGFNFCETLRQFASVARKVKLSLRREGLSYGHHKKVAHLSEVQQKIWLARALEKGWSAVELRESMDAARLRVVFALQQKEPDAKPKQKIKVFLDSGAYSAWTSNKKINIKEYIAFVKDCEPFLDQYVNLDVIPGTIDRMRTMADVEASAKASYRNLQIMKDAGLKPIPVFHQQEHYSWLEKMLKDGETYIGISSAKNQTNTVQERWLDEFFTVVCDGEGRPLIRVHGFGAAHVDILKRHPYYSVDSAGWRIAAAYGKMYVPQYVKGKPDYLRPPVLVTMSGNKQESKHSQSRQFSNPGFFGPLTLDVVRRFLEEEVGVNAGLARYSDRIRYRALAVYYQRVSEALKSVRHTHRSGSFGSGGEANVHKLLLRRRPIAMDHLQFIFSTAYDYDNCQALIEAEAYHHLLSYWEFKTRPDKKGMDKRSHAPRRELIRNYVIEGKVEQRPKKIAEAADWTDRRYIAHRGRSLAQRVLKAKKEAPNATRRPHIKTRDGEAGSGR